MKVDQGSLLEFLLAGSLLLSVTEANLPSLIKGDNKSGGDVSKTCRTGTTLEELISLSSCVRDHLESISCAFNRDRYIDHRTSISPLSLNNVTSVATLTLSYVKAALLLLIQSRISQAPQIQIVPVPVVGTSISRTIASKDYVLTMMN